MAQVDWDRDADSVNKLRWRVKDAQHRAELARIPYDGSLRALKSLRIMVWTQGLVAVVLTVVMLVTNRLPMPQHAQLLGILVLLVIFTGWGGFAILKERRRNIELRAKWLTAKMVATNLTELYESVR